MRVAIVLACLVVVSACATAPAPPSPSIPALASEAPDESAAMRFRQAIGLRADAAWVRTVAADPSANKDHGFPLTALEKRQVDARLRGATAALSAVNTYGATQPEFVGAGLDVRRGGIVVASFSGRIDEHRDALRRLVSDVPFELNAVAFGLEELRALADQVAADSDWMRSIGAALVSSGVDTVRGLVMVEISSANPDAARAIVEHYQAQGRMYVLSDGIGTALMPKGTLLIIATDRSGNPARSLVVSCTGELPRTGTGDMGDGTDSNGEWRAQLIATVYDCTLSDAKGVVGSGRASVEAGEVSQLRITVR